MSETTRVRRYQFTPAEEVAVAAALKRLAATWPPLTQQQKDRLSALLRPAVAKRHTQPTSAA